MCVNPVKTAGALLAAVGPTLKSLLTVFGLINTTSGIAVIAAYNAATAALQNWVSGTAAQNIIELLTVFQNVFSSLPLPTTAVLFSNIIIGGIVAVIGILTGNSPAPAPPAGVVVHEESKAMYQAHVAADTAEKVQALVPGFQRSIWHSPESQYNKAWNAAVDANPSAGIAKV